MNRTLTLTLTIALIGSLTVMGLAGTTVASGITDTSSDGATASATATVVQDQSVQQSNTATVDQHVEQQAESGDSGIDIEIGLNGDENGGPGNPTL